MVMQLDTTRPPDTLQPLVAPHERVLGLDIVRSVAIILVMVSHWANNLGVWYGVTVPQDVFFSGEIGVDLFFALSGFLIGRILIGIMANRPSWRSLLTFLSRRWLRTLPVYFTCLLLLAVFFPPETGLAAHLVRFASMTQNLTRPMPADFWFAVSWSLTVEEWFYLLFGTACIAGAMLMPRRWALFLPLAAILILPAMLRLAIPGFSDWSTGYAKMVPFRLDEIGYGVLLAWLSTQRNWIFRHPLLPLLAGLSLIACAWLALLPIPFHYYVVFQHTLAVIGCALCIPAALRIRTAPRWLGFAARHVSRLSYVLYLVHLTILVEIAQALWWIHRISTTTAVLIALVGPFLVAELLSRTIEQPFMRMRPRQV
jgi:peptidoglycan/LPS O-acetylase OafA/YrhL